MLLLRYYVPYEEMYDKLKDFHTRTGHGGNVKLRLALMNKYAIPRPAIEAFLSTCLSCNSKKPVNRKLVIKPIISHNYYYFSYIFFY